MGKTSQPQNAKSPAHDLDPALDLIVGTKGDD
jgi:hypothetical protein